LDSHQTTAFDRAHKPLAVALVLRLPRLGAPTDDGDCGQERRLAFKLLHQPTDSGEVGLCGGDIMIKGNFGSNRYMDGFSLHAK